MNALAAYETDKIAKQVIRYASALSRWDDPSGQVRYVKDFCDVAEIVHSADIAKFESEVSSKLSSRNAFP
jgi:uncharacterized protein YqiB (DUF1249 family)